MDEKGTEKLAPDLDQQDAEQRNTEDEQDEADRPHLRRPRAWCRIMP